MIDPDRIVEIVTKCMPLWHKGEQVTLDPKDVIDLANQYIVIVDLIDVMAARPYVDHVEDDEALAMWEKWYQIADQRLGNVMKEVYGLTAHYKEV
jgi:hypothetical protein